MQEVKRFIKNTVIPYVSEGSTFTDSIAVDDDFINLLRSLLEEKGFKVVATNVDGGEECVCVWAVEIYLK